MYQCHATLPKALAQRFQITPFGGDNFWMYIHPYNTPWLCFEMNTEVNSYLVLRPCSARHTQRFGLSRRRVDYGNPYG